MTRLRKECPWDAEQTHTSIRPNMIEEAYEAAEAIDTGDDVLLCEELGDVLLQVVFHATMAAERNAFTLDDVISGVCAKLVDRHPHVFGQANVTDSEQVLRNWEQIKNDSKGFSGLREELNAISKALPGLVRLQKVLKKVDKAAVSIPVMGGYEHELMLLARKANTDGIDLDTAAAIAGRALIDGCAGE